jgi:NAD(P)-dependent dehydrogenase (short-subunit alcohol dehydrogenase family)
MKTKCTYNFEGKVAFVTGGSTGIGEATARLFAKSNAKVLIADVNIDAGLKVAHEISLAGGTCEFIRCDVSNESDVQNAVGKAQTLWGRLDIAFNNSGVEGDQGLTDQCSSENWDNVININLKGVWLCMKYQIPLILQQGGGSIVNCSSIAGLVGFAGIPAYVASKHAVLGLTKTAALEYAKKNIRINAVCPGVIQTPMIDRFTHGEAQARKMLADGEPIGRIGQPIEIAETVLWLCSEASSFVTGLPLVVDGGWVAQ